LECIGHFLFIFEKPGIKDICVMPSKFESAWLHTKALLYKFLGVISTILLLVIILRNPMLSDDHFEELKHILPKHTNIFRQIPSTRINIPLNTLGQIDLLTEAADKKVYQYIQDSLLHKNKEATVALDPITPMHKIMLLLGCYGDRWGLATVDNMDSLEKILSQSYMQHTGNTGRPAFFVNLMLQAFDNYQTQHTILGAQFPQSTYDKSTCSCLRDFAGPSLLTVTNQKVHNCSLDGRTYQHDTCSMQGLLDYAIDSSPVTDGTQRDKIIVPTRGSPSQRNLKDPILTEIESFETELKKMPTYLDTLTFVSDDVKIVELQKFLITYCKYASYASTPHLKCPAEWFNADASWKVSIKVQIVIDHMKTWPRFMHTYNKLRTPFLTSDRNDGTSASQLTQLGFETYIEKYKAAFETCTSNGVQSYSTEITGRTQAVHWYVIGQLFLLLASSLSFFWAHVVKEKATQEQAQNHNYSNYVFLNSLYSVISMVLPLVLLIIVIVYYGQFQWLELEENQEVSSEYGYFLTGFASVWLLLNLILIVIYVLAFLKTVGTNYFALSWLCCCQCFTRKTSAEAEKNPDATRQDRGRYAVVKNLEKAGMAVLAFDRNVHELNTHVFWAQIALDLPVIVGLTLTAVGTTLQRGVADYNLILSVIILCTTTGLITHITNVLRLVDMRTKAKSITTQEDKTPEAPAVTPEAEKTAVLRAQVENIKYNRVFIGLIIALMLYVFLNLAGLDAIQGSEFSVLHQTWFAIVAFVILVCGDLSLEFFAVFYNQYESEHHFWYTSIQQKSSCTGWLIIFGLFLLELHQRYWLCPKYELSGADTVGRPLLCSYW
jgi:hypothetical protein